MIKKMKKHHDPRCQAEKITLYVLSSYTFGNGCGAIMIGKKDKKICMRIRRSHSPRHATLMPCFRPK